MTKTLTKLVLLLTFFSVGICARASETRSSTVLARSTNLYGKQSIVFDYDVSPASAPTEQRQSIEVTEHEIIRCIGLCGNFKNTKTATEYPPFAVAHLQRHSLRIFGLLASGSAYRVFVYDINANGFKRSTEIGTESYAQFLLDNNGDPIIVTQQPEEPREVRTIITRGIPYSFNGKRYALGLSAASASLGATIRR